MTEHEWVAFSERLPTNDNAERDMVLALARAGSLYASPYRLEAGHTMERYEATLYDVTHWMVLPEPPK